MQEKEKWNTGNKTSDYYQRKLMEASVDASRELQKQKVLKPEEMPWEYCAQGKLKHLANQDMPTRLHTVNAYIQELPPSGCSGKHRHMGEEAIYILEGKGYDLHWDVTVEIVDNYQWKAEETPRRVEWAAGDVVYIPVNTIHQHFNADSSNPARFIAAGNRLYDFLGYNDLEQLEPACPGFTGEAKADGK